MGTRRSFRKPLTLIPLVRRAGSTWLCAIFHFYFVLAVVVAGILVVQ